MTTFKDFIRDKHFDIYVGEEGEREDSFEEWKEHLSNRELSDYLTDYLNTLSPKDTAHLAYEILQNQ